MKKILGSLFILILAVTSVFGFSACSCAMQAEEIDVSASISTKTDYLLTNVYNKTAGTDFNTEESEDYVLDEEYYVVVKSSVADILQSVKIGGIDFADDDTVSLSVGNNNFLIRNAWKLEEESLMIASGLLLSSTDEEGKVSVEYGGKMLSLTTLDDSTSIDFDIEVEGEGATITGPTEEIYTYTSNNNEGFFKISLNDGDESLLTANSVIAVEKIKKDTNGDVIDITYGLTKTDLIGDEYFLIFYPAYNAGEDFTVSEPENYRMEFRFLVIDVGADSFTYDFVNSAT